MRRELRRVTGSEPIGPYTLLRLAQGGLDAGIPGQFFMLEAPGRVLPRPMSVCLAEAGELSFLIDPIGPGTRALCALGPGDEIHVLGPLGNGFDLDVERPLLVGGAIPIPPLPYLSQQLGGPPAILGFRSELHAEAVALLPGAEVCIEPVYVTALLPEEHRRAAEAGGEKRQRSDADAAADEERPLDVEVEPVPERAEHVQLLPCVQGAEGARARTDGVDEERELAGGRKANAHRPREHASRCLEHEELARDARVQPAALHPEERVRADRLGAGDLTPLASHARSVPGGSGRSPPARWRSRRPRGAPRRAW